VKEKEDKESLVVQPLPPQQKQSPLKILEDILHNNRILQKKVEMHKTQNIADIYRQPLTEI
jgi:hypothetical protein